MEIKYQKHNTSSYILNESFLHQRHLLVFNFILSDSTSPPVPGIFLSRVFKPI